MVTGVRQDCARCKECDRLKLGVALVTLAQATRLIHIVGARCVRGSKYAVAVSQARLEFIWDEPYANNLTIVCPKIGK